MSRIRSKNTKPELLLRSGLHKKGYRFRLHNVNLPGKPDLVFPKYRAVIFVHGCFWHYHFYCRDGHIPKSNEKYWKEKLINNVQRDKQHVLDLEAQGWKVLIVWECEINNDIESVISQAEDFLIS